MSDFKMDPEVFKKASIKLAERYAAAPEEGFAAGYQPIRGPRIMSREIGSSYSAPAETDFLAWLQGILARTAPAIGVRYRIDRGMGADAWTLHTWRED